MKIALFYPPMFLSPGKTLSLDSLTRQVLTGSELSMIMQYTGLMRTHDVHVYMPGPVAGRAMGFDLASAKLRGNYDVAISWNDSSPLGVFDERTLRMVSYHLNSFDSHREDVDSFVDVWLSPSRAHIDEIPSFCRRENVRVPDMSKWRVLPNGCEPNSYDQYVRSGVEKVRGRVVWASSPDRGLHHLLEIWPDIRAKVPHATLHVMYDLGWIKRAMNIGPSSDMADQKAKAKRTHDLIVGLQGRPDRGGLRVLGPIDHDMVEHEMAQAEVLAYPCDPHRWTESYSVTLMEGCAARACPITAAVDALPSIYGSVLPMVPAPAGEHLGEFTELVVRALTDRGFRDGVNDGARRLAET